MGELAYGIWANLCPDLTCEPRRGGADFRDRSGRTVDVKSSDGNGDLSVELSKERKQCCYYVSVVITKSKEFIENESGFCRAEIVGYAWAEEVFHVKHRRPGLGGEDYFRVPRAELHPPDPLP
jgi:hypothetical protein